MMSASIEYFNDWGLNSAVFVSAVYWSQEQWPGYKRGHKKNTKG